jgi:D-alanine-D-alanine ligase
MKICVLNPSYERSESPFKGYDPYCDPAPYCPGHEWERCLINKATAVQQILQLEKRGFDVFVNLCDGAWDEDRAGIEVCQALERLGLPYTGATPAFYEPTREMMKRVCHYWDIPTPRFVFAHDEGAVELATRWLRFPMIVKHPNSYGSIGLLRESRVEDVGQLREQVRRMLGLYGGALIEEFIAGREFTVLLAENPDDELEPLAFLPAECRFPEGETFKHFDLKWNTYEALLWAPCTDEVLGERLKDLSRSMFVGLAGKGYARCDLRMDAEGQVYMLEINPNCAVFYPPDEPGSADIILRHDPIGPAGFVEHIMKVALRRAERARRKFAVRFDPEKGYGLVALAPFAAGELIERYEEQPQRLVSKAHVERSWSGLKRSWFHRYAYPLTDEIYALWSDNPGDWKPLNHSCDPNSWLAGLDLVARRDIAAGEEITADYATFCSGTMEPFECWCGAPECRGKVTGDDCLQPFVTERYRGHTSEYVRRRRRARRKAAGVANGGNGGAAAEPEEQLVLPGKEAAESGANARRDAEGTG